MTAPFHETEFISKSQPLPDCIITGEAFRCQAKGAKREGRETAQQTLQIAAQSSSDCCILFKVLLHHVEKISITGTDLSIYWSTEQMQTLQNFESHLVFIFLLDLSFNQKFPETNDMQLKKTTDESASHNQQLSNRHHGIMKIQSSLQQLARLSREMGLWTVMKKGVAEKGNYFWYCTLCIACTLTFLYESL